MSLTSDTNGSIMRKSKNHSNAKPILLSWIGFADLNAAVGKPGAGLGPIGQAITTNRYE